jgi:coproporphyrinogen III oxidase
MIYTAQNDQALIAWFTSTRGGGDPAPPCVSEAENGKNEKAPTVAGTEKYGVTGAYTRFKKYCEKEA